MPIFLKYRQPHLTEYMDQENCDPELLENTYRQFNTVNMLLSQWKRIYKYYLKPRMQIGKRYTLLDIGFGGGDIPIKIAQWAKKDGFDLLITAIEQDPRAIEFVRRKKAPSNIRYRLISSSDLLEEGTRFDFVISNHLLHHLSNKEKNRLLRESKSLANRLVLFNDIERSDLGYLLFNIFSRLIFRRSYITADGLTSIKRSYTLNELIEQTPYNWKVKRMFPFRILLIHDSNQ
ncbi:MAG: methyltransferase domain-containing protein [Balneolaceae bacterium]|nr:methyltransferase domain-containing protein [Balneolaceae bacterium]